jgi:hypothetical protein
METLSQFQKIQKSKITDYDLRQFTGCDLDQFSRHPIFKPIIYTLGAKYVFEKGGRHGAYWLLDHIASILLTKKEFRDQDMVVIELVVNLEKEIGDIYYSYEYTNDGKWDKKIVCFHIDYTDFDREQIKFWACRNELGGHTILLPSEY